MPETETPPTPKHLLTGWHTSVVDGYGHAVTNAAFTESVHQRHGQYETACELVICLAASVAPCAHPCPRYSMLVRARVTPHPPADTRPPRRRLDWPRRVSSCRTRGVSA